MPLYSAFSRYSVLMAVTTVWRTTLWVPSQKGLLAEAPQRQREKAVLPVRAYLLPSASTISITPLGSSMRNGPSLRTVIVTCGMKPPGEVAFRVSHTEFSVLGSQFSVNLFEGVLAIGY